MNIIQSNLAHPGGRIAIVISTFNEEINQGMLAGAQAVFAKNGMPREAVDILYVPGAFELPYACQKAAQSGQYEGVLAIGSVIKGETAHFEYICDAATHGLMRVGLESKIPVIYGLLTTYDRQQALVRADQDGKNKGAEVAEALLAMLNLDQHF